MDRNSFHTLVLLTKEVGGLTDSKYMSSREKLAMFLNILAHHEKNRSIKVDYVRSGWSVSQAFNECLKAILKLAPLLVNLKPVLEDELDDRWRWFKGCLGALDGTYIQLRVPSKDKPRYKTRKEEIATNVLGVCDRNLNFTYVSPGWEGSVADGRVLRNVIARANGLKISEGNDYLCDGGYTNGNGFLSPYREYRYWLRDWQDYTDKMDSQKSSMNPPKRSRRSTPSTQRTWTPPEESSLINGLKELCVNDWRADNGTFRPEYLMELEHYLRERHPQYGEYAEGPLDAVEDILKSQTSGLSTDMSLEFLIDVDGDEYEDEASHEPNAPTEEAENDTGPNFTGASENEYARGSPHEHTGASGKKASMLKSFLLVSMKKRKAKKENEFLRMLMKHF